MGWGQLPSKTYHWILHMVRTSPMKYSLNVNSALIVFYYKNQQGWPSSTSFGLSEGSHWGSSLVGAERLQSSSHPEPWHSQGIIICHAITILNCFWAEISLKVVRLFSGTVLSDLNKQVYKDLSYDVYDSTLNGVVAAVSLPMHSKRTWFQTTMAGDFLQTSMVAEETNSKPPTLPLHQVKKQFLHSIKKPQLFKLSQGCLLWRKYTILQLLSLKLWTRGTCLSRSIQHLRFWVLSSECISI